MSYMVTQHWIGGDGGSPFDFDGTDNGATLKKIWVWAGGWQIHSIQVWLSDDRSNHFGKPGGTFSEFEFEDGEHFTSLSLWGNGAGTRLGAIKIKTNHGRQFFPQMTSWGLKTEYPIDVGSGICMGVAGRCGEDVDCFCFKFINTIKHSRLTDVDYPTIHTEIPNVAVEEIKSTTYHNDSSETQEYKIETVKTISRKSSWSVTNKIETNFHLEVKAGIPELFEMSSGFSLTIGSERFYGLENSEEKSEAFSFPIKVPPGKTTDVKITIGRAVFDLPYRGTVEITCYNDSYLTFPVKGVYKGVSYTEAKVVVKEGA